MIRERAFCSGSPPQYQYLRGLSIDARRCAPTRGDTEMMRSRTRNYSAIEWTDDARDHDDQDKARKQDTSKHALTIEGVRIQEPLLQVYRCARVGLNVQSLQLRGRSGPLAPGTRQSWLLVSPDGAKLLLCASIL